MPKQADSTPRNVEFLKDLAEEENQDILAREKWHQR